MADQNEEIEKILNSLKSVELRLSKLESALNITDSESIYISEKHQETVDPILNGVILNDEEKGIESRIGRFGLAWLGNIVLLFGITFLTQYMMNLGYRFFSFLIGYIASASIFLLADYIKKANVHLAFTFRINALVLLFYFTVRLHFFSFSPIIPGKIISIFMLLILVALQVYLSIRNKSQPFAALAVFFALATAILGDTTNLTLPIVMITAAGVVYIYRRFNWEPLLIVTIFLTYLVFFLWLFGNPLSGHTMEMITEHHFGIIYLFGLGVCFSIVSLFRKTI